MACTCDAAGENLNLGNCTDIIGQIVSFGLGSNGSGAANRVSIDLDVSAFPDNTLKNLIRNADKKKRIFPMFLSEGQGQNTEDAVFETSQGGYKSYVRNGIKSFTFTYWDQKAHSAMTSKVESFRCGKVGATIFTTNGIIMYKVGTEARLIPIQALSAKNALATQSTVANLEVMFEFTPNVKAGNLYFMTYEELGTTFDEFFDLGGLVDIRIKEFAAPVKNQPANGKTTIKVYVRDDFKGGAGKQNTITGILQADWILNNNTTSTPVAVTIDAASATTDGYTLSFANAPAGNKLELSVSTDSGFEAATTYSFTAPA